MKAHLLVAAGQLLLVGGAGFAIAQAQHKPTPAGWTLPPAAAEAWARRVRAFAPPGWTVSARGNEVIIQRDQPVNFAPMPINAPPLRPGEKPPEPPLTRGNYRITLRFAPKLSQDDYDGRAAVNEASERERFRLEAKLNLVHKFDSYLATTPAEQARLQEFRAAKARLPWHDLPDLYSTDHSITWVQSWHPLTYVHDDKIFAECREVQQALLRLFGMYETDRVHDPNHYPSRWEG